MTYTTQKLAELCNIQHETVLRWITEERKEWNKKPLPTYQIENGIIRFNQEESEAFAIHVANRVKNKCNSKYELRQCKCPTCGHVFKQKIEIGSFAPSVRFCRIYCSQHSHYRHIPEDTKDFAISGVRMRMRTI